MKLILWTNLFSFTMTLVKGPLRVPNFTWVRLTRMTLQNGGADILYFETKQATFHDRGHSGNNRDSLSLPKYLWNPTWAEGLCEGDCSPIEAAQFRRVQGFVHCLPKPRIKEPGAFSLAGKKEGQEPLRKTLQEFREPNLILGARHHLNLHHWFDDLIWWKRDPPSMRGDPLDSTKKNAGSFSKLEDQSCHPSDHGRALHSSADKSLTKNSQHKKNDVATSATLKNSDNFSQEFRQSHRKKIISVPVHHTDTLDLGCPYGTISESQLNYVGRISSPSQANGGKFPLQSP